MSVWFLASELSTCVTVTDVHEALIPLDIDKSAGFDDISPTKVL